MPVLNLEVESYQVSVRNFRWNTTGVPSQHPRTRKLILRSRPFDHGFQIQTIMDLTFYSEATDTPIVGFVTTPNYYQHFLFAYFPIGEFNEFYDVLRNHESVYASFSAENDAAYNSATSANTSPISWFQIGTSSELISDGSGSGVDSITSLLKIYLPEFVGS